MIVVRTAIPKLREVSPASASSFRQEVLPVIGVEVNQPHTIIIPTREARTRLLFLEASPPFTRCLPVGLVLVILTSRFDATRELFWNGPHNFEPRVDNEDDT
ncbi:hypothetical protein AVEN_249382-1 [Araneus ventricosus]|uniref:Uncharacterized protein n=1 Tax=Araneus ventricosus TaxID=182803 RepID=A0A4Y2TC84_ARAVE|nr:hypothetical protein AVEN_249382-1 [Araneus ventricosus]